MKKSTIMTLAMMIVLSTPTKLSVDKPIVYKPKVIQTVKIKSVKPIIKKAVRVAPQLIDIRVSYYTNSTADCGNTKGISASGKNLRTLSRGGDTNITYIAVPKNIKFGTRFYIKGLGICEAVDRGGAIRWHGDTMYIDVFVPHATARELNEMGVKNTKGYIIK